MSGYDVSVNTYSPEGRVFQVEYATKAVDNSGTVVGLRCSDGVVLAVEKLVVSKMLVEGSNRRIFNVDKHVGMAAAGFVADARQLVNRARAESSNFLSLYGEKITGRVLCDRIASLVHFYTQYWAVRPFGCSVMMATHDKHGAGLYLVEPSGVAYGYFGCATGKARQAAKTEIEMLDLQEMTCRQAAREAARIITKLHDAKDKDFELEMSWLCEESGWVHGLVPEDVMEDAKAFAAEATKEEGDGAAGEASSSGVAMAVDS